MCMSDRSVTVHYLDCSQALLAVPLLNTNVDVVLGIRSIGVLISRVRKGICEDKEAR